MRKAELGRMREIGEPYAVKAARTVREEAVGKGLALVGTSLAAYFNRWVQRYAPELEKRSRPHLKATNDSWRVDETYVKVKKVWMSLSRAVDSASATRWTFGSVPPAMPKPPNASSRKRWLRLIPPPLV